MHPFAYSSISIQVKKFHTPKIALKPLKKFQYVNTKIEIKLIIQISFSAKIPYPPVVASCNNSCDPLTASLAPHSFPNQMNQIRAIVGHLLSFFHLFYDVHVCIVFVSDTDSSLLHSNSIIQ